MGMAHWSITCRALWFHYHRPKLLQAAYIADGYDAALDVLRETSRDGRKAIAALEAKYYREETGVSALKIKHNGVLGYHIEVAAKAADTLMAPDSGFTHRQTLAGVVRFNALALHEEAAKVVQAGAQGAGRGSSPS